MKRKSIEEVKEYLSKNTKLELLSTEYTNRKQKLKFKCECGNIFETSMASLMASNNKTHCNDCSLKRLSEKFSHSQLEIERKIREVLGDDYKVISEYKNINTKIDVLHKCGYIWNVRPSAITSQKQKCPRCFNTIKKTTDEFKKEVFDLFGDEFEVIGEYINTHTHIGMKHKVCGREWKQEPSHFLTYKSCPLCSKEGKSKGEDKIESFLISKDIEFKREYRINKCRNIKPLPFDFAIFKDNNMMMLIEYDGEQHFKPRFEFDSGEESFLNTQRNDKIKTDFCKNNNIKLLRIPYWEFKNIDSILDSALN